MNDEIIININKKLQSIEEIYKKRLEDFKDEDEKKNSETIINFLNQYKQNGTINIDLLSQFFDKINAEEEITYYKKIIDYLSYCNEHNEGGLLDYDIKMANKKINSLIESINIYHNKIIKKARDDGGKKRSIMNIIEYCNIIIKTIDKVYDNVPLSEEEFNKLISVIKEIDIELLNEEEKKYFVEFISKYNAKIINQLINKEMLEVELEKKNREKEKQKKEKQKKEKVIETIKPLETEKVEETIDKSPQDILLDKAKKIIKSIEGVKEFPLVTKRLKEDDKWKARFSTYNAAESIEEQLLTIAYDLKTFIVPKIERELRVSNTIEPTDLSILEKAVNLYEQKNKELTEKGQSIELICEKYLKETNNVEHLNLINACNELINNCINNPNYAINIQDLVSKMNDYYNVLNEYRNELTEENFQLLTLITEDLKEEYYKTLKKYNEKASKDENIKARLIEEGKSFYEGINPIKNFYFFSNFDETLLSSLEADVLSDKRLPMKTIENIVKTLRTTIGKDLITSPDKHKAKTGRYDEDFLKKYHVKRIDCGQCRIIYSLFNSGLIINGQKVNIVFLHSIGFGATDGKVKSTTFEKGLDVCYDNKEEIDRVIELFNTDLDKLDEITRKEKEKEMIELLETQYTKLGHLIETSQTINLGKKRDDTDE